MGEIKSKKPVRRRSMKAGNSPEPTPTPSTDDEASTGAASCGHSHCGSSCKVYYTGPTSRISDHHALHAARGSTHIWTAAIVSGFAVILTGAIAFHSAQAASDRVSAERTQRAKQDISRDLQTLNKRIEDLQGLIKKVNDRCAGVAAEAAATGTAPGAATLTKDAVPTLTPEKTQESMDKTAVNP